MMKKLSALFALTLLFLARPQAARAQDYSIKDDTIRVSNSSFPMLTFMGEIQDYNRLCNDYNLITSTTTITIRPSTSKPVKVCPLIVTEGSKKKPRQHRFIIVFDKNADPAEQIHDYSTKELMQARIDYLAKMQEGKGAVASSDEDKEEEKPKKGKRGKHKDEEESDKPKEEEKPKQTAKAEPPAKTPSKPAKAAAEEEPQTADAGNTSADDLVEIKDIPQEQLQARVKQKINAFYRACENLCSKVDVDGAIKYGMKLFNNNEDVIVATTNAKTNASRPQKIRQYFVHLSQLNYKKVEMTASEIKFVSNFHKGPDGNWHASAVIIQDFKGYKDYNILAYKDQTSKTVDIVITMSEEVKDGKTVKKFDIYLGNISVTNVPAT